MFIASAKELQKAGRKISFPFRLSLSHNQPALTCTQALRILPGKRLTCLGEWKGEPVIVKLFFDPWHWHRHGRREKKGSELLCRSEIPTPALLFAGKAEGLTLYIVIFEYLEKGQKLDPFPSPSLTSLVNLLAVEHQRGIVHQDVHLDNFLGCDHQIYQLDSGAVSATLFQMPLWQRDSLYYLAMLLSQYAALLPAQRELLLENYCQQRQWALTPALKKQFYHLLERQSDHRQRLVLKKIFKDCTAVVFKKTFRSLFAFDRAEDAFGLKNLLSTVDALLENPSCLLKNGNTCTVGKVKMNQHDYVVKRYNVKNPLHRLRCALHRTRAEKSWYNAHYLSLLEIPTAKPVALWEERWGPLRGKAYFISRFLPGETLTDYLSQESSAAQYPAIADQITQLFQRLFSARLSHGDLKATNFIVVNDIVHLIDLDSLQTHRTQWGLRRAWKKDWQRFMRNWQDNPTLTELFSQLYCKQKLCFCAAFKQRKK